MRNVVGAWDPEVIDQAIPQLEEKPRNNHRRGGPQEPPVTLFGRALEVWRGEKPKAKDTGEIDRSASLMKLGRVLYDAGANRAVIEEALRERDEVLGWRKYTGRADAGERYAELVDELERNGRNGTASIKASGNGARREGFNNTDLGNSGRLIFHHGEDLRFCFPWGRWLVWDGRRWSVDSSGEVHRRAKRTVKEIYREAGGATDDEARKALAKHAMRSEAEARIQAMISLAKSEVPVMPEELDRDPWLLNVLNGTLDLRTGELREHRRDDLLTKLAPVEYSPDAEAPTWAAVLERTIPSEPVREFFKKLCGRAFSGDVSEHVLPVLYGTGANGKSTVLNALLEAAGEYGMQAAPDLLIAKRGNHPTEVADLFGMRFVASIEVEDGRRLAESLVKTLTGGDRVRARRMRQDFWEFAPTHKVFMAVNHKPQVKGSETAIWRRIKLISFTETIPAAEQDKNLPEKLRAELPGILRWAVEGCLEWRREGLQEPTAVTDATAEYRADMDTLAGFFEDCCVIDARLMTPAGSLYEAYKIWCGGAGEHTETQKMFGTRLSERGFVSEKIKRGQHKDRKGWQGIGLRADDSEPEDPDDGDNTKLCGAFGAGDGPLPPPHSG